MGVLTKQNQATAKNGLTFNGTAGTVSVSGGNHRHQIYCTNTNFDIGAHRNYLGAMNMGGSYNANGSGYAEYSGDLSMSGSFTPSGTISGDTETRPNNYTVKVWKRIN